MPRADTGERSAKLCERFWCLADGSCSKAGVPDLRTAEAPIPRRGIQRLQSSNLWRDRPNSLLAYVWSSYGYACPELRSAKSALPGRRPAFDAVCFEIGVLTLDGVFIHEQNENPAMSYRCILV